MLFIVVGLNYTGAPLSIRERLAFSPEEAVAALRGRPPVLEEAAILSTCNRTEVYALCRDEDTGFEGVKEFLSQSKGLTREFFSPYLYLYTGETAIKHLFLVTSGLDSMVLGEDQIQGQVKRALELALEAGSAKRVLAHLFRRALEVGKRCRHETELGRYRVSVSSCALQVAEKLFGNLSRLTLLIISAGETGELTGKIARESGAGRILVTNRTFSRAEALARTLGGEAVPFSALKEALATADLVVSATSSPGYIVDVNTVGEALARRGSRPLLIFDLAVPRDFDPEVRLLKGVHLYDIDDLKEEARSGNGERAQVLEKAEEIVEEETGKTLKWWLSQQAVPVIKALREKAEAIRRKELAETLKKLNLSPEETQLLEALTRAIVNGILHSPTVKLKENPEYAAAVRELFSLEVGIGDAAIRPGVTAWQFLNFKKRAW